MGKWDRIYALAAILCVVGVICLGTLAFPSTPSIVKFMESEMGVPILRGAIIESPAVIFNVNYEKFLIKIVEFNATEVYQTHGGASVGYYCVFNRDMTIAYKYSVSLLDMQSASRRMKG